MASEKRDRMGPAEGAGEGPNERLVGSPRLAEVHRDFATLKRGIGLTPAKMSEARAVLAALGEVHPVAATQRLLDDLADLTGDDGAALAWALRADPRVHTGQTLDSRRQASKVPENTAKDREKRAVEQLYQKWMQSREDWGKSAFEVVVSALPARQRPSWVG